MKCPVIAALTIVAWAGAVTDAGAQEAEPRRQYGVSVMGGVSGAPLGEVAESYGLPAVPGVALEARLVTRSPAGSEWSLGVSGDEYSIAHDPRPFGEWSFDYTSIALVAGRSWRGELEDAGFRFGVDVGWRHFTVNSTRPDIYQAVTSSSSVTGDAALVAVTYALEVPQQRYILSPLVRIETSYPDFGGGDGYSALHRESDLGYRVSFGVELKALTDR